MKTVEKYYTAKELVRLGSLKKIIGKKIILNLYGTLSSRIIKKL